MKIFTTLLIFAVYLNSFSQNSKTEYKNFKLQENKTLIWQKVFEFDASKDSIVKLLKAFKSSNSFINKLDYNNYSFSGTSNYSKISDMNGMPLGVQTEFNCFIKIDVKEQKHRITISDLKFKPITIDFGGIETNNSFSIEDIAVRNNYHEIRKNNTARKVLTNLNNDLLNLLTLKENKNEDW
ncbi:hypothetical protein K8354_15970 [Polaribacter litorisediminis]|uniref:hypothetical protein n=1 Tax=Polaribacter litorisediminis TaxID=1908341 RepID=UPI001CBD5508|nr:hypothetical protein [Polaribacter litorisediminis]UAM97771.1 hypothetical protein K8354_15970 [Polaribacter litorisediminis]